MVIKWDVTIPKLSGDKTRRTFIYLPESYEQDPERRYPVLYMFDGHNLFEDQEATYGKSWGLKDYLDHSGLPLIVVGMECNHEGNSRLVEYSPYTFTDHQFGTIAGSGRQMMRWVVEELKPLIDRELPTLTSRKDTWIAGSSMGGLMSLYTITAHNDTFSSISLSQVLARIYIINSSEISYRVHHCSNVLSGIYLRDAGLLSHFCYVGYRHQGCEQSSFTCIEFYAIFLAQFVDVNLVVKSKVYIGVLWLCITACASVSVQQFHGRYRQFSVVNLVNDLCIYALAY